MTTSEAAVANGAEKTAPPVGMVTHLKYLIESLPVCVMRTDLEGRLLAVNDSALQMLGVTEHAKVLGKSLNERIIGEHGDDWRAFIQRGWEEGASSVECEFVDFVGAHRVVQVKSVAQPTHADGIPSLIITAQDLALRRRLERALNDHQGCATAIDALRAQLQDAETERERIAALLDTVQADTGKSADYESTIETLKQHTLALEQEWQTRCEDLKAQIATDAAERDNLALGLADREVVHQELTATIAQHEAESAAAREQLQQRISELERSIIANDQEWQRRCEDLTAQLAAEAAERQQLSSISDEQNAAHQAAAEVAGRDAAYQQLTLQLAERDAEQQRLAAQLADRDLELQRLTAQFVERAAEVQQLTTQLAEHGAERQRLTALLAAREAEQQELAARLTAREAEHQQLSHALEQREHDQHAAEASLQNRIQELESSIAVSEQEWQKRCDDLKTELSVHTAARLELAETLAVRDVEHQSARSTWQQQIDALEQALKATQDASRNRVSVGADFQRRIDELELAIQTKDAEYRQRRSELTDEVAAHVKKEERLAGLLKEHEAAQQQWTETLKRGETEKRAAETAHHAAVEALQQQIVECERALAASDETWKHRCEELANELAGKDQERTRRSEQLTAQLLDHANERQRLASLLEETEAELQRLVNQHAVEKVQIERSVRGEYERQQVVAEEVRRREFDGLRLQMAQLASDLQTTGSKLVERTADFDRVKAEYARMTADYDRVNAELSRIERIDAADFHRLKKSVEAYRVELVQITENTVRTLEPMAAAGRVAMASSRELQAAVEAVDARSKELLAQCALDDANRQHIERLRRDVIGAASLVRQLVQAFGELGRGTTEGEAV